MIGKPIATQDKERIRNGDIKLLKEHLSELDITLIKKLKVEKDETRFYQGASRMLDHILEILK